jgi:hypothetical protein
MKFSLLLCTRPLLALLRHANRLGNCPLTGVDRKSPWSGQTDAFDPQQTRRACLSLANEARR